MSPRAITRRLEKGSWRKVYRSVLTPFPVEVDWFGMQMGACLQAGEYSVAAGAAAARLRCLPSFPKAPVEILMNGDVRTCGVIVHRTSTPLGRPRVFGSGIPIEGCESMLVRIAARYQPSLVGQALDECWRRNMTDPVRLARFLEGKGRGARGVRVMHRLLKERHAWSEVTDSEMESLFLRLAERYRLVPDRSHVVIYDGERRIKEVDFVYVGRKLVIELDSYKHHGGVDPFDHDREVDVVLQRLGWRVLRFTWRQLNERPDWVFSEIRSALGIEPLSPAN